MSKGSQGSVENRQAKAATECWYCGRKGHKKESARRRRLIRTNPNQVEPNKEFSNDRTTSWAPKELKTERAQPL